MRQKLRWDYNMPKLIYTPKALDDLQEIKTYVAKQFDGNKTKTCIREITSTVRQLEIFPEKGPCVEDLIEYPTDYHYLVVKPNYIFYRIEPSKKLTGINQKPAHVL